MNKSQKRIIKLIIVYLILITLLTFTNIENELSSNLGLKRQGTIIQGGVFIPRSGNHPFWPVYGSFAVYILIGIIIAVAFLKLYEG